MNLYKSIILTVILFFQFSCSQNTQEIFIVAGTGVPGFVDGVTAQFNKPIRLAPFENNSVVVADINNHAIRIVSLEGTVTTIAGGPDKVGFLDGSAEIAKFKSPHGVAFNSKTGDIFVAEAGNHVIRQLTPQKGEKYSYEVSTFAGIHEKGGFKDGSKMEAMFNSPHSIILSGDKLIVADIGNARIRAVSGDSVRTIAGTGEFGNTDASPMLSTFKYPMDMVMGKNNSIFIADAGTHQIRNLVLDQKVTTVELKDTLNTPHGITIDNEGILYVADMRTHRILSVNKSGEINVVCGNGKPGSKVEQLNKPAAVLVHAGHLWITDLNNHQIKAMKL